MKYEENSGITTLYLVRDKKKPGESSYYSFSLSDIEKIIDKIMKKHNVGCCNIKCSNLGPQMYCDYSNRREKTRISQAFQEFAGKKVRKMIIKHLFAKGKNDKVVEFVKYNMYFSLNPKND